MGMDMLKGRWHQIVGEAKKQWGKLTDDDLKEAEGDTEKMLGKIQERYGYERSRAETELNEFMKRHS